MLALVAGGWGLGGQLESRDMGWTAGWISASPAALWAALLAASEVGFLISGTTGILHSLPSSTTSIDKEKHSREKGSGAWECRPTAVECYVKRIQTFQPKRMP